MRIRRATAADIPALLALDRENPVSAQWSQGQYQNLFAEKDSQSGWHLILVAQNAQPDLEQVSTGPPPAPPEIVASLVANKVDTEWELENIVVAEKSRRQSLGGKLLQAFINHVQEAGGVVFLEVRESNHGAQQFYQRFGFEITGRRKNYYSNPHEDAVLYRRVVKKF